MNRVFAALSPAVLTLISGCIYSPVVSPEVLEPDEYCVGVNMYSTGISGTNKRILGMGSVYARHGLVKDYELGAGYSYPLGLYLDVKRQITREPLVAADLALSVDRHETFTVHMYSCDPMWWVVGVTPSVVIGTPDLYGGVQVIAQREFQGRFPTYHYVFPGIIGGASILTDDNPFRIVPSLGLFLDPGLNRRPLHLLLTAGVAVQFDFSDFDYD